MNSNWNLIGSLEHELTLVLENVGKHILLPSIHAWFWSEILAASEL